jgi:hypothetical protein
MNAIKGTYKDGKIVLDAPAEWPEGCRVVVEPVPEEETFGVREEDWSDTPEAIAAWLRWYDTLEPLVWTPGEEADLQAWQQKMKAFNVEAVRRQMKEGLQ